MIKVLFFAQVRELVGTDATEVAADFPTVEALRQHLAAQSDRWALALEDGKLLAAVNQTLGLRWQKPKLLSARSRSA
ncbi:molybdopterin synthase sulfur carrier subunit [Escherichia coli]|nr:molybdopterin synthase sulfur carrier subunit [Escherichia coli]PJI60976.1 molybdopterin synthase sulfur carrier subunit [Escherichia coli]